VRAVAPDGSAAYQAALTQDLAARRAAGRELLGNPRISLSPAARDELTSGQVDARLLIMLAAVATAEPVRVAEFGDSGPGAGPGMPLREAQVAVPGGAGAAPALRNILTFARAQRPPYLPAQAAITPGRHGSSVLNIEFSAPSPLGLLETRPGPIRQG
jgi:hypothetical protein